MYKQFKDIKNIRFPIYALKSSDWYRQDGMLFIDDSKVLDDTNMPGTSLGVRRLQCGRKDLYRLKKAYIDFTSMIKSKDRIFIDSNGIPFIYKRTLNSPLVHHAVRSIEGKGDHSIVWLREIHYPMNIPRQPMGEPRWARVLYFKKVPWMIYDFTSERGKDSYRRV